MQLIHGLMQIEWGHIAVESTGLGITLFGMMWAWRREDRKERQHIRESTQAQQDTRHKENQDKLDLLLHENEERPPHLHIEADNEPLNEGGIRYKPGSRRAR